MFGTHNNNSGKRKNMGNNTLSSNNRGGETTRQDNNIDYDERLIEMQKTSILENDIQYYQAVPEISINDTNLKSEGSKI